MNANSPSHPDPERSPKLPLPEHRDKLASFVEISASIVARQKAQAAILEAKRFLRSTLDTLPQCIAILDEESRILEVNAAWIRSADTEIFWGHRCVVGERYSEHCLALPEAGTEAVQALLHGLKATVAGTQSEFRLEYNLCRGEATSWFEVRISRCEGIGPTRTIVAHENITARKQLEFELNRARTLS